MWTETEEERDRRLSKLQLTEGAQGLDAEELTLRARRIPVLVVYLSPFRIISSKELPQWDATLDQINRCGWDYVALHEIAGGMDVGLPAPYHMVVARDGALALPCLDRFWPQERAVEFFNRCLGALLLGGVYCEAITPDGVEVGSIIDWKYVRSTHGGKLASNRLHFHIRMRAASSLEAISLLRPRVFEIDDLCQAMVEGLSVLGQVQPLRAEFLLRGVTGLARRDWGTALANLWIATEQLVSHLWDRHIVAPATDLGGKKRREQLNDNDGRTWTASARIELLHQTGRMDIDTLKALSVARKARNDLAHKGEYPQQQHVEAAYRGICSLLTTALEGKRLRLAPGRHRRVGFVDDSRQHPLPIRHRGQKRLEQSVDDLTCAALDLPPPIRLTTS